MFNEWQSRLLISIEFLSNNKERKANPTRKVVVVNATDLPALLTYLNQTKKSLIIVCDDFVYSGQQMTQELFIPSFRRAFGIGNYKENNIEFFLNVVGFTQKGLRIVKGIFSETNLHYSPKVVIAQNLNSILHEISHKKRNVAEYLFDFDVFIKNADDTYSSLLHINYPEFFRNQNLTKPRN